jgi:TonB-linked SusC/RagA family outer membrane protein
MKLTIILFFIGLLQVNARGFSQGVSINEKHITLEKVFRQITRQTGYLFFYTDEMIQKTGSLDLNVSNAPLDKTLEVLFRNQPLSYSILGKTVILKMKTATISDGVSGETMALIRITIQGKVTDAKGNPLAGASIKISGTNTGTTTDNDGRYTLQVTDKQSVTFSYIGYDPQTVKINGRTEINISLVESGKGLGEIVVVAYGSIKKTNMTGSVVSVTSAQIEDKPFTSVDKSLQGAVAGLQSVATSGTPGASQEIRIRGIGSFSGADPLWVIDGIISNTGDLSMNTTTSNTLSTLNPDDIESVSVLKDASATAIYGSRGANGVIIVTTKKGKSGQTKFNFTTEAGQNSKAYQSKIVPMNADQFITMTRESLTNLGLSVDSANSILTDNYGYGQGYNTNWLKLLTRTGTQNSYNLSMSGGNDKTTIYTSVGFFNQVGTTLASSFKRWNGDLSLSHKATDKLTISTSLNGSYVSQHTPLNSGNFGNPIGAGYFLIPTYSPRLPSGGWNYNTVEFPQSNTYNPFAIDSLCSNTIDFTTIRGFLSGEYKLLNNLKLTSRFGAEYIEIQENNFLSPVYGDGAPTQGDAYSNNQRVFNWTWTNFADYRQKLNADNDIYVDLKAGYESQLNRNFTIIAEGQNLPNTPGLTYAGVAASPFQTGANPTANSTKSIFSLGDLNIKDRYILSGSFRRDESSKFGVNKKAGNFYSVGGSWNINNEQFLKDQNLITSLKLRSSYGVSGGSSAIQNYEALSTYSYGNFTYQNVQYINNYNQNPGSVPFNIGNPNLTWERSKAFNIGLDYGVLKNRIFGTIEFYSRKTVGLLQDVPLSATGGYLTQAQNVGDLQNRGIEISLGGIPIQTKDFTWTISGNISHNQNRILALYGGQPILSNTYNFNYTVGHDMQTYYLPQWAGVDPANGNPLWYTDATEKTKTNNYNNAQMILKYSAAAKIYGGLSTNLNYKGISLQADLYYNLGNYIYDPWAFYLNGDGANGGINELSNELNRWQKPGDITNVPQYINGGNMNSSNNSTRFLYKGDYIRLRNLQLGYNLPSDLMKRAHLGSLSIYLRGTNLFTWVKDKTLPYDPETGINGQTNLEVFIPKTITAGLKLGF